jgi:hypothetical protein
LFQSFDLAPNYVFQTFHQSKYRTQEGGRQHTKNKKRDIIHILSPNTFRGMPTQPANPTLDWGSSRHGNTLPFLGNSL